MTSRIFISYRREDTRQAVGRLTDDLGKHFAREQVFDDITSIVPGADFVEALQQGLDTCAAMLVVIGPRWLTASDRQERRRFDLADDWVRHEVAKSLRRAGLGRIDFPVTRGRVRADPGVIAALAGSGSADHVAPLGSGALQGAALSACETSTYIWRLW